MAEDPEAEAVFKNQALNMDVFYRYGETHQVCADILMFFFLLFYHFLFQFGLLGYLYIEIIRVFLLTLLGCSLSTFKVVILVLGFWFYNLECVEIVKIEFLLVR